MKNTGYMFGSMVVVVTCGTVACAQPSFTPIGDLPGGFELSTLRGLSGDGTVAVGGSHGLTGLEPVMWTALSGLVSVAPAGAAQAASYNGSTIVGHALNGAFRWTKSGGIQDLGVLPGGTPGLSVAEGVSSNGATVVGRSGSTHGGAEAFRWTESGGMQGLGDLPGGGFFSWARDVSASGNKVVGFGHNEQGQQPFVWTPSTGMEQLPVLAGFTGGTARVITPDGQFIGGVLDFDDGTIQREEPVIWTPTGVIELGQLPGGGDAGGVGDLSADGSVALGSSLTELSSTAFYWTEATGMLNLKDHLIGLGVTGLEGWHLQRGTGISDDGLTFAGYGINPMGMSEGWVATIPTPSTTLPMLGLVCIASCRRR